LEKKRLKEKIKKKEKLKNEDSRRQINFGRS
jgi:hypothetical protein